MIPDEIIEQVRDSADLVRVIGEVVSLKRTGADWRGPCPFHGGTHRNFAVIPRKGRYYCFVCKEAGDIFSWHMKRAGLSYPDAVREVARSLGIVIPENTQRQGPDPREPLFSAVAVAHDWFVRQFRDAPEAAEARKYVVGRGFELDTIEPLEFGFAPRGSGFQPAMAQLGLDDAALLESGLLARREDGSVVPRFRGRLLLPIHDLRGRVVGFGGRLLGPGEPKYLNSPETPIFKKGQTLYNLHAARNSIRKEGAVIVVEGYFDVLRLALAGCEHVVAPLGTALTSDQAELLRRITTQAILLLDSDMAGLKATFRAGDELLRHELRVRVATLPPGEDPDTLVQRGGLAALESVLADAIDLLERKIQILDRKGWFSGIEHRREALDRLLPTIRAAKDPIQRELYLSLVAERSGVDKKVLEAEVASRPEPAPRPVAPRSEEWVDAEPRPARGDGSKAERILLHLMEVSGEWRARARQVVLEDWFEAEDYRRLFGLLREIAGEGPAQVPEGLDLRLGSLWARLLSERDLVAPDRHDQNFVAACDQLAARPIERELLYMDAGIKRAIDPAERRDLYNRMGALREELRREHPSATAAYGAHRMRRRARRS